MSEQKEYTILDQGFVRLIDFMGGDLAVVQAARVSFGKDITDAERDHKLLNFLLQNHHETPFEHSVFKFHIKCPIFIARQWFRHRISSFNEISGRYTQMEEEFYLPEKLRSQKTKNYQYIDCEESVNEAMRVKIDDFYKLSYKLYQELIEAGVAKEHARIVLPLSLYTQFYWTANARALMNFLSLRLDTHAQFEIQQFAQALDEIFAQKMPWTRAAFHKFILKGTQQ